MKIYKISRFEFEYDTYDAHVVAANNEDQVIELAIEHCSNEGDLVWREANISILGEYAGSDDNPFIILSSFNAG